MIGEHDAPATEPTVGELLRRWRSRRRWSQLDLSVRCGVSARHISFMETGRTIPSRRMVLRLAESLDAPLRERNQMLAAAGYEPQYLERALDGPDLAVIGEAVSGVLRGHEPYPALAVDGLFDIVAANATLTALLAGADADLLTPPVNMMRLGLHPRGLMGMLANPAEVRAAMLARLARAAAGDRRLDRLYGEVAALPVVEAPGEPAPEPPRGRRARRNDPPAVVADIALPIRLRYEGRVLSFVNTVATFASARDVTLAEIAIEAYYPADTATAEYLRARDAAPG